MNPIIRRSQANVRPPVSKSPRRLEVTCAHLCSRSRWLCDPSAPQHEDSFLPVAYPFFLCEHHSQLTSNINFQDNLLNVLLTRHLPWETERR